MTVVRTTADLPLVVVHADREHGVARYARQVAAAVARETSGDPAVELADLALLTHGTPLHVQFTDRLWGSSPALAADAVADLAARHPLIVTLHDVPQPSDGARNLHRRAAAYARVAGLAQAVVCNSAHEASLLRDHTSDVRAIVIPLPVSPEPGRVISDPDHPVQLDRDVAVLGFFYPGKGHDEVLEAVSRMPGPSRIVVLGRASAGHEPDLEDFVARGRDAGVVVEVTGFLDDAELLRRCRRAGVPVLAHRHVSASGSLNTWIEAGRRAVVVANRYTEEMAALRPGTVALTPADGLGTAIGAALEDPASTVIGEGVSTRPHLVDTARAHLSLWRTVSEGVST